MARADRLKILAATAATSSLAILDFVAVLAIGLLGAVVAATETGDPLGLPAWVSPLESMQTENLVLFLGLGASVLLVSKGLLSWFLLRRILLFVARRIPDFCERVFGTYMTSSFPEAQMLSLSNVNLAISGGGLALGGLLTATVSLVSEIALLSLLLILLIAASPWLLLGSAVYFAIIALVLFRVLGTKARETGSELVGASISVGETINASVGLAPEIRLYGIESEFIDRLKTNQTICSEAGARQQSWFQTPRYVLEAAVIVGFTFVAAVAFSLQEPARAVFTVGLFLVASTRLMPSLLRLNGAWGNLKASTIHMTYLQAVLALPHENGMGSASAENATSSTMGAGPNSWLLRLEDVDYGYPSGDGLSLQGINLEIPLGSKVALVGPTGSGKSTLALVIAGLIQPTNGRVLSSDTILYSRQVGIVPQDVYLASGSIRGNVTLAFADQAVDDHAVWDALEAAQVAELVQTLPDGLDAEVGERGIRLSGGEVQRIGLARALFRNPNLLVLDEATSSLDAETERRVSEELANRTRNGTVVTIAHRLSTVKEADLIVLLNNGRIAGTGTFGEMVANYPDFANAATLQGLLDSDSAPEDVPARAPESRAEDFLQ